MGCQLSLKKQIQIRENDLINIDSILETLKTGITRFCFEERRDKVEKELAELKLQLAQSGEPEVAEDSQDSPEPFPLPWEECGFMEWLQGLFPGKQLVQPKNQ